MIRLYNKLFILSTRFYFYFLVVGWGGTRGGNSINYVHWCLSEWQRKAESVPWDMSMFSVLPAIALLWGQDAIVFPT